MKKSRYTYLLDVDDRKVAFNSMTCAMAEVDDEFINMFDRIEEIREDEISEGEGELIGNMIYGGYVVPEAINELDLVKLRNYSGRFSVDFLSLIIAPTLECNFGCPYCYEYPKSGCIGQDVQDRLVDLVRENAACKRNIDITWYGGEPLLYREIVFNLSERFIEICENYGVAYSASMITNGYLLTEEDRERFEQYAIQTVQITIDGTEETHNSRRFLKEAPGEGTFGKIIDHVRMLYSWGTDITIRINIDRTNIEEAKGLILYLKDLSIPNVSIVFGHVSQSTEFNEGIQDDCLSMAEYAQANLELQEFLFDHGFEGFEFPHYPAIKKNYCGADSINTFVIDPRGYQYKCWNEVGNVKNSVGNIMWDENDRTAEMIARHAAYMTWSPFENEGCRECKILPICMGGCPYIGIERGHKRCERWKFSLTDTIKKMYKQRIEADVEE
ncbi:MAG: SPASM domain-containing protein [Peptococcaceae bacterium]|nr:SPASM domain-containing protein [Peptococcaceae bacterium]